MSKLAVIIMDALDVTLLRAFDMEYAEELYEKSGDVLTCSTYTHTCTSNIMIWSGQHREMFWIKNEGYDWIDPAKHMNRQKTSQDAWKNKDQISIIDYEDIKETGVDFIWDWCEENGLEARALQLPITLPPYSYNVLEETPHWFPYEVEGIEGNREDKHRLTMKSLKEMAEGDLDFFCTSFVSPDKALHSPAEGHAPKDFPQTEIPKLDEVVKDIDQFCRENDITYVIIGDHGRPSGDGGPNFQPHMKEKLKLVRHTEHSVIIGNADNKPTYTEDIYSWMKDILKQ